MILLIVINENIDYSYKIQHTGTEINPFYQVFAFDFTAFSIILSDSTININLFLEFEL